jgi:periplasmic protein TonB
MPARGVVPEQEDVMHAPIAIRSNGYLDKKTSHPGLLAAAVVLHVGLLGAILSYHPEIIGISERPIPLIPISKDLPPPPLKTDKKPTKQQIKADPRPQPEQPRKIVLTGSTADSWPEPPQQPPIDLGTGGGGKEIVDPVTVPVLIKATGDPRFDRDRQPPYPPALERLEIEGSVTIRVQIGTDGRVTAVELIKTDDPAFFASTRDWALKRWRFKPATRDGVAVTSWLTRTVHFRIVRDGIR